MFRCFAAVIILCLFGFLSPAAAQEDLFWAGPTTIDVSENVGTVQLELVFGGMSEGFIEVSTRVAAGSTATSGTDFQGGVETFQWFPGSPTSVRLDVLITDDNLAETQESILIELHALTGALMPAETTVRININDNDGAPELPRVSLVGGLQAHTEVQTVYCYDAQNIMYGCGETLTAEYSALDVRNFRLSVNPALAPGDTLYVLLASAGGIYLNHEVVRLTYLTSLEQGFYVVNDGPAPFGSVSILPSADYAPPQSGDFHEMNLRVFAAEEWNSGNNCASCAITAQISRNPDDCGGSGCGPTTGCEGEDSPVKITGNKSATGDLDLLRRYRDEMLAGSGNGAAVIDLYQDMGQGVVQAFFAAPSLSGDYVNARNSWLPALEDLLDGAGTMVITASMQSDLTTFLDNLAAAGSGDLVGQLTDLRQAAGLDSLTGKTVATAHADFTSGGATPLEATSWGDLKARYR